MAGRGRSSFDKQFSRREKSPSRCAPARLHRSYRSRWAAATRGRECSARVERWVLRVEGLALAQIRQHSFLEADFFEDRYEARSGADGVPADVEEKVLGIVRPVVGGEHLFEQSQRLLAVIQL